MPYFYEWETVDLIITLDEEDALVDYSDVIVSLNQWGFRSINKDASELDIDVNSNTIMLHLSQRESGRFREGEALLQVNIYYDDAERDTSEMASIEVRNNLYKEVMG